MKYISLKDVDKEQYDIYTFEKDLEYIRPVILLCMLLYGIFGFLDWAFYAQYLSLFLAVRFLFVIPVFILGLLASYHKSFRYTYQYVLMCMLVAGGFGIIFMIYTIQEANYYYGGLYLVFSVSFFLLRLKPAFASVGATMLIVSFFLIGLLWSGILIEELIAESIFYCGFVLIGIVGASFHEQYRLNQYYQETIMIGENIVLEKQIFKQYEDTKNYHSATIFALATLAESRDRFTGEHINRVGKLSRILANKIPKEYYEKNKIDKDDLVHSIELASTLHDIGKISISDVILNKPGKLTDEEFEIVKTHTTIGFETLQRIQSDYEDNSFVSLGIEISKSHHERWDGKGYPEGLAVDNIPLSARIVSLIDVYDALISERSYKQPFSKEKSIQLILEGVGTQFDPIIAKIFIALVSNETDSYLYGDSEGLV